MNKIYKFPLKSLALLCLLSSAFQQAGATVYTLNGAANASIQWSDPTAWTPNGVPGAGDDVTINGSANTYLNTIGDITVKSLTINSLAYIFGPGTLTVTENLDTRFPMNWQMRLVIGAGANASMTDVNFSNVFTGIYFYSDLIVDGNLVMEAQAFSGSNVIVNGTLTQKEGNLSARVFVSPGGVLNINSPNFKVDLGRVENHGTFNWQNGDLFSVGGAIINKGLWNVQTTNAKLSYSGIFQDSLVYNSGTIQVAANVNSLNIAKKMANAGLINLNGPCNLSLLALDHYGTISGPAGSTLTVSGSYFGTANTFFSGSVVNVPTFKTAISTSLAINPGANISAIQDFFLDQGTLELGVALPPTARYQIRASIQTNVNQNFTGVFLLEGGTFDGTCNITFDTPDFTALSGYFGGNVSVLLSANTILSVESLGIAEFINNGVINWRKNGVIGVSKPGITNNGTWNITGDSVYFLGYPDESVVAYCKNKGVLNCNKSLAQFATIFENTGTINLGENTKFEVIGELHQSGTIAGQGPGAKLSLYNSYAAHRFLPGAQTGVLSAIEMNYGKTIFDEGTLFTNIEQFVADNGTLETELILPPAAQYNFKKSLLRLNTKFEPNTVLELEDTNVEGSGNLRISNGMNWNGGTLDVPIRIYENAFVNVREKEERPIISAPFTNEGDITLSGGIIEINTGFFKNAGNWNVDSDVDVIMDGFTSFTNDGIFSICGNQPIEISFNVPFINNASGTFKGQGSYTFNAGFSNNGTIAPGCSPGILTIDDNLNAPSVIQIEVTGGNTGEYDQLLISGNMSAAGLLDVVVPPGASLNGSIKVIQTGGTFTGAFAQVNLPPSFTLQYLPDGVLLTSDGTVGTELPFQTAALRVTPTLASERLLVTAQQNIPQGAQLEMYQLNGQLVQRTPWPSGAVQQEMSLEKLPNGLYTLRLNNVPDWHQKIVVQH